VFISFNRSIAVTNGLLAVFLALDQRFGYEFLGVGPACRNTYPGASQ